MENIKLAERQARLVPWEDCVRHVCMYAYPGNGIIDGKTESYVDVCTMSKK